MAERTFIMLKPDTVQRDLIGEIIGRFERRGLKIVAMKLIQMDKKTAQKLYETHKGKEFFEPLVKYVISGPCVVAVLESKHCIDIVRKMLGSTDPKNAEPGSIRGDFGMQMRRNVVHASDSLETAKREISIFFSKDEIIDYKKSDEEWVYEH
ncbi:MAG: nucleoside-diphosphate kinase [Candidatus Altiarchaeota archaeon]|nr:nucleoside-diphosphate kinase [Candidatus Altiarchaeota archaeon]